MKIKHISLLIFFFASTSLFSQKAVDSTISDLNNYRWQLEFAIGDSKGIRPYKTGYYSSNNQKTFDVRLNSVDIAANYNFSKLLDFKVGLGFDRFSNKEDKSLPYESAQFRSTFQTVMNLNTLLRFNDDSSRFKLLIHGGLSISVLQNVDTNTNDRPVSKDLNGGIVFGFTPMYRISKKIHLYLDFNSFTNYRQHRSWDGNHTAVSENLNGHMINTSIGLNVSLGKQIKLETIDEKNTRINDSIFNKRIGNIETMLNDTDTDGVADYLDRENNSIAGVTVDSRGVMVDFNKNGVPDELERYFDQKYGNGNESGTTTKTEGGEVIKPKKSTDFIKKSINDGYISVFFDSNRTKPSALSVDNINYILMYLKNNPFANIEIIGHADEIGDSKRNEKLANNRALEIKNILIKSGIETERLIITSEGEDTSVDAKSNFARSLVRRVTFKIN